MVALGQRGRSPIGASFLPREDSGLGRKRTGLRSSRKVSNRSHLEACSPGYQPKACLREGSQDQQHLLSTFSGWSLYNIISSSPQ